LDDRKNNPLLNKAGIPPTSAWEHEADENKEETFTDEQGNVFIKRKVEKKKKFLLPW
jgi:hypothetical protein